MAHAKKGTIMNRDKDATTESDRKRLDWLESVFGEVSHPVICGEPSGDLWFVYTATQIKGIWSGPTLRAAIDEAMAEWEEKSPN